MTGETRTVRVALPLPIRQTFTYAVPDGARPPEPGTRVRVPLGERALTGVVMPGDAGETPGATRAILEVLDDEPVCPPDLLATAERVARRCFAATGEVLRAALPARLPASGAIRYRVTERGALASPGAVTAAERAVLDALAGGAPRRVVELPGEGGGRREILRDLEERGFVRPGSAVREIRRRVEFAYEAAAPPGEARDAQVGRSRRGREALAYLDALGRAGTAAEVREATGAGPAVLKLLAERGLVRRFEQERRDAPPPQRRAGPPIEATPAQEAAVARIAAAVTERRFYAALLQGVTGSGKTEVYLRSIRAALDAGRGAVWLVPEIALTPVFARELSRQFGPLAAVLHSALSERERADAWDRVRRGEARAVIGPRSAAFAPVADPGLFVVDEEHDASYKQRESPRYDARDVVALRAKENGAALVLGTATPSMEAWHAAESGRLDRLLLPERIAGRALPSVEIVDLRRETARPDEKGVPLFSRPLLARLEQVFARGEQAILLQPRRGFAPFLLCRECGEDFRCRQCSVSRTVHERGRRLVCHYCGERAPAPLRCPQCGGGVLEAVGAGTERVAERFAERFPGVPCVVLDRDAARRRGGADAVVDAMRSGAVQCLIGTQMVAKGHDFPGVTAVGVLSADTLLNFPDFRAAEKTFQLLAQVAGRSGRGDAPGTVHVQTFHPEHPAIRRAAAHDADGFARSELEFRRAFFYPPFAELAAILVSSADRDRAEAAAARIGAALRAGPEGLRLSGPAPAPLERLQGRWRFQILVRAGDRRSVLAALEAAVPERPPAQVQIAVDVDPQDLM
ncbi:MAG TPA: primosomal protein N' [Thermoanaerobaculia bacterium]|nr:primosomal protein N' [Thermoanaerobaculia bacterium]